MTKAADKARPKAPKRKRGRPTKFNQAMAQRILALATKGKTDAQIARAIGVGLSTFKNWKAERPDFLAALKKAKDVADQLVEASLFQRAIGYQHPSLKIMTHEGRIITQRYTERYPPDTTAAIFWLKNRRPDLWRDVHKHEHTGEDGKPIEARQVTAIEITQAAREAVANAGEPSEDF